MRSSTLIIWLMILSCNNGPANETVDRPMDTVITPAPANDSMVTQTPVPVFSQPDPDSIVAFAKTLIGVPYLYASTDPARGFDCSGFITYVFNHFQLQVPRSSVDFTNYGKDISLADAKPGDLILFTGTDSSIRVVGHMGIITSNSDSLRFIHSSSGKANGVIITALGKYYMGRFVKVIRIFPDELFQ